MVRGYRPPTPVLDRIKAKTLHEGDCWRWTGSCNKDGYGQIMTGSRTDGSRKLKLVHRVAYEELVGPIPEGLEIDHDCHTRDCWNPQHLEPVTHKVNMAFDRVSPQARVTMVNSGKRLAPKGRAALDAKRKVA